MTNNFTSQNQADISEAASVIKDWVTVEEFCAEFPNIPKKTIKWQLTSRSNNGLEPYVQVIGKQRYISIRGYAIWLKQHAASANQATTD